MHLFHYVEHLEISHLKITLVAHQAIWFIVLGETALVLTTSIAYCACTSLAMMSAFAHDPTKFFGKCLLARETLLVIFKLEFILELLRESVKAFFLLPHLV